jgi:hypothetical protein
MASPPIGAILTSLSVRYGPRRWCNTVAAEVSAIAIVVTTIAIFAWGCAQRLPPERHVIPEGFIGAVIILHEVSNGDPPIYEGETTKQVGQLQAHASGDRTDKRSCDRTDRRQCDRTKRSYFVAGAVISSKKILPPTMVITDLRSLI